MIVRITIRRERRFGLKHVFVAPLFADPRDRLEAVFEPPAHGPGREKVPDRVDREPGDIRALASVEPVTVGHERDLVSRVLLERDARIPAKPAGFKRGAVRHLPVRGHAAGLLGFAHLADRARPVKKRPVHHGKTEQSDEHCNSLRARTGAPIEALDLSDVTADHVKRFPKFLESERGNGIATRNAHASNDRLVLAVSVDCSSKARAMPSSLSAFS